MLLDDIKTILDFKNNALALQEAQSKLAGTILKISQKGKYENQKFSVRSFFDSNTMELVNPKGDSFILKETNENTAIKIDVWLPETGVYFTKQGFPVLIIKKPKRQWKKSFNLENYKIDLLDEDNFFTNYNEIIDESRTEFWINKQKKRMMYFGKQIGKIENNSIICTNMLFEQEIKDWIRKIK